MDDNFIDRTDEKWTKAGGLLVDLSSFESGFHLHPERVKYRKEILEYIQYRESLLKWPAMNEEIKRRIKKE
jgi:hypothetical protein